MRTPVFALAVATICAAYTTTRVHPLGTAAPGAPLASSIAGGPFAAAAPSTASERSPARAPLPARARLIDADGSVVGEAILRETANVGVLIELRARDLPPGAHGFHIHETGRCDPPTFESAGGHYAPRGDEHGFLNPRGPHAGDLPNLHVPASGELVVEHRAPAVTLRPDAPDTLFDDDRSALVIHAGADDYRTDPAGASGDRIVCGVIRS